MKEGVTKVIDTLTQEDFDGAFQKFLEWYNKCIAAGGDYFEGGYSFMCVLSIKVPIRKKSGNLFNDPCMYIYIYIYIYIHIYIWIYKCTYIDTFDCFLGYLLWRFQINIIITYFHAEDIFLKNISVGNQYFLFKSERSILKIFSNLFQSKDTRSIFDGI